MAPLPTSPAEFPQAFARAWAARDAGALTALFAHDADFVNVVGIWWRDAAAIERAHALGLTTFFAQSTLRIGRVAVRELGPDHAVVHARMHLHGQIAPDGRTAGPRQTIMLFVLGRRDGGWIGLAAQNTEIIAGAETMLAGNDSSVRPQDYRDGD